MVEKENRPPREGRFLLKFDHFIVGSAGGQIPIEGRLGSGAVGTEEQVADAHGEGTQDVPADKAEIKAEELPLMSLHKLF